MRTGHDDMMVADAVKQTKQPDRRVGLARAAAHAATAHGRKRPAEGSAGRV